MSQHRSLRQAADALNVRQSTLSRRLSNLEYRLGTVLFERGNGGTRPTNMGLEFLESAKRIVEEADAVFIRLKTRCRGESGRLVIGIYASFSIGNLHATLLEHRRRFPDVDVQTVDGTGDRLFGELASNAIDIAIMTKSHPRWDERMLPLWSERVIVAMPAQHRLAERSTIHWPDLVNERVLMQERGPGPDLEQLLTSRLHGLGSVRILHQDVGLDRLLSLVSANYGLLLVLEGATGAHYEGVVYRELHGHDGPTRLNFMAYWHRANTNPTLIPFLQMLRERYPDLSADPPHS